MRTESTENYQINGLSTKQLLTYVHIQSKQCQSKVEWWRAFESWGRRVGSQNRPGPTPRREVDESNYRGQGEGATPPLRAAHSTEPKP